MVAVAVGLVYFTYTVFVIPSALLSQRRPEGVQLPVSVAVLHDMVRSEVALQTKDLQGRIFTDPTSGQPFPPVLDIPDNQRLRILVTGGAGFLGSHLVDRLMRQGHSVICMDNFFTGKPHNVRHWRGHPHFQLIEHDVVNPIMLEVDQIYHLACPASPPYYQYNPIKTIKVNTYGTLNALGLAKRVGAKILLASAAEMYEH